MFHTLPLTPTRCADVHVYDVYTKYLLLHAMSAILTCAHVIWTVDFDPGHSSEEISHVRSSTVASWFP